MASRQWLAHVWKLLTSWLMVKVLAYTQRTMLTHFKPKPRVSIYPTSVPICTYINSGALYSQPGGKYPLVWAELHNALWISDCTFTHTYIQVQRSSQLSRDFTYESRKCIVFTRDVCFCIHHRIWTHISWTLYVEFTTLYMHSTVSTMQRLTAMTCTEQEQQCNA